MTDWESIKGCACGENLEGKTYEEKINHLKMHIENARKKEDNII
jgi:hypothetical protein